MILSSQKLKETISNRSNDPFDKELVSYLDRINKSPYAITVSSCIGHMLYAPKHIKPDNHTKKYGYLDMFVYVDLAKHLHMVAQDNHWREWIWIEGSQLNVKGASEPTMVKETLNWWSICFAWDASHGTKPAEIIAKAVEAFVVK
jgi:hypothetical protein